MQNLDRILNEDIIAADCESDGIYPHLGNRLFSVIISGAKDSSYLNFNEREDFSLNRSLLGNLVIKDKIIFFANAKFDLALLEKEGVQFINCKFWDVLVVDKCIMNTHMRYDLDSVAKRYGLEKLKTVEEYIKKNQLYSKDKSGTHIPRYDWVPFSIMQEYGIRDGRITYDIGVAQMEKVALLEEFSKKEGFPSFKELIEREMKVTEVCYEMEKTGMRIDREFISRATAHEQEKSVRAIKSFEEITGLSFVDSNKSLSAAFKSVGVDGGTTAKGNPSFTDDVLEGIRHPIAQTVRDYRNSNKKISTYYSNFLKFADSNDIVHASIRQAGADTFRFSITDPALQTLNSKEKGEIKVRDSFIAPIGHFLVALDFKQQEYRLTADYAGEMALIKQIMNGADVHEATAKLMSSTRDEAKMLGFMLLYGGGIAKLAFALYDTVLGVDALKALTWKYIYKSLPKEKSEALIVQQNLAKITQEQINHDLPLIQQAQALREKYFVTLPRTKAFIDKVIERARDRGYIYNWAGRRLHFPDKRFAYKAPNHLIQSSGAEIMRGSMIDLHDFLKPYKSKMVLSVHDELDFSVPEDEFYLLPKIQEIMKNVYKPFNGLYMDTSIKIGKSWGSMESYDAYKT
jgi:DNA polymerase-1